MKATIKLIRNILAKFNLITNLTAKNLALHQQLIAMNRTIKRSQIKTIKKEAKSADDLIIIYTHHELVLGFLNPISPVL